MQFSSDKKYQHFGLKVKIKKKLKNRNGANDNSYVARLRDRRRRRCRMPWGCLRPRGCRDRWPVPAPRSYRRRTAHLRSLLHQFKVIRWNLWSTYRFHKVEIGRELSFLDFKILFKSTFVNISGPILVFSVEISQHFWFLVQNYQKNSICVEILGFKVNIFSF